MSYFAWSGILLLFAVSMIVRVLPTLWPGLDRIDLERGVLADLPQVVLVNLIAACVVLEVQANWLPAATGFAVAGILCWLRPGGNLLIQLSCAVFAYVGVAWLQT